MAKCRKEILLPGKGAARIAFNKYFQYSFSSTASRQRTSLTGPPGFPFTVERKSLFKMDFRRRFVSSIVFTFCRVGVKVGGRVALYILALNVERPCEKRRAEELTPFIIEHSCIVRDTIVK